MSVFPVSKQDFNTMFDERARKGQAYYLREFITLGVEVTYNTLSCPADKYVLFDSEPTASEETEFILYENSE